MSNNHTKSPFNFWKKNQLALNLVAIVLFLSVTLGLAYNFIAGQTPDLAKAASEPACQSVATTPTWNPYPLNTSYPNPTVTPNNCQDIPVLSFFPVDTGSGNPREKNILRSQNVSLQLYYNNGAQPGSAAIQNPKVKVQFSRVSDTRYRISAELSGTNAGSVTSAQKGGDLFLNVPTGARFDIVANSTDHFPDAIERKEESDTTGRAPNDSIPDNTTSNNVSNAIYSVFEGKTLAATDGFIVKPGGLEAGFLGYGYILTQIGVQVQPQGLPNNPPAVNGDEITIIRGETGTFTAPITPTDPDGDYPVSVDVSQVPASCSVNGTKNSQGGGQTITCRTDQNSPGRQTFNLIPTDSRGLVGTQGTWIINVIDPNLVPEKKCFVKGTTTECKNAPLKAGDQVKYEVKATNNSTVRANKVKIVDNYDGQRLTNITAISNDGQLNASASTITWADLGTLQPSNSITVTFEATVANTVQLGDIIVNTAKVSAEGFPEREVKAEFTIGGTLDLVKRCFARNTTTPCSDASLTARSPITYEIDVTNSTQSEVKNVILTDQYDKTRLTDIGNIQPTGTLDVNAGTIVWNLGDMPTGSKKTVKFDAVIAESVAPGTIIKNIAIVKADGIPEKRVEVDFPTIGPRIVSEKLCFRRATTTPCQNANLLPNEAITYVIRTTNNGTVVVENVTITDTYDFNRLTNITNVQPQAEVNTNTGTIVWNLGNLAAGKTVEVRFDAVIKPEVPTGIIINNVAVVRATGLPDQTVKADFPVQFLVNVTPRTGGGVALIIVALLVGLGSAGYYYYKKNSKFAGNFVPGRSQESKTSTNLKTSEKTDSSHKHSLRSGPRKK